MIIRILVRRSGSVYIARSLYPEVECESSSKESAVNFVRGTCLMVIGSWDRVPREIEFATVQVFRPNELREPYAR